jgi:hypothetical protein
MKIRSYLGCFIATGVRPGPEFTVTGWKRQMWNVLKFTYSFPAESQLHTKIHAYLHLGECENIFDHIELAYQFDAPLRVKGGKRIKIKSVSLYTSFREDRSEAETEVANGGARLIRDAHEFEIDLD